MTKRATGGTGPLLALALAVGCGGSGVRAGEPTAAPACARPDATTSDAAEARRLIEVQLHAHQEAMWKCVTDYLDENNAGRDVSLDFAIDQEGTLVGVVVVGPRKSGKDPELDACMRVALHDAIFPKSRSGIITVREDWDGF